MHKLTSKPITIEDFEIDDYNKDLPLEGNLTVGTYASEVIRFCEILRQRYLKTRQKRYWKELIRWLPESYLQTRTVTMSYENIYNIIRQRKNHKLNEWSGNDAPQHINFMSWARQLPYADELLFLDIDKK